MKIMFVKHASQVERWLHTNVSLLVAADRETDAVLFGSLLIQGA